MKSFPSDDVIEHKLSHKDIFVFCGHGNGQEHYRYSKLIDHRINCKATMFLMGCQSGALTDSGDMEPTGAAVYSLAAGATAYVGALWNVTDGEINRFFNSLLDDVKTGKIEVEQAVARAREACRLKYLTGGAVVVYGFPALISK